MNSNKKYSLLVEGGALPLILDQLYFSYLIENCESAVCCRITPKNKA
jgi:magnesium-transporting ATPase (P-type)